MNDRIAQVRKSAGLTQEAFAGQIKLSRNFVWMLENGERTPSDRTIDDICNKFNVDEYWLRTGKGEMFIKKGREDEIIDFMSALSKEPNTFKSRLISALSRLDSEQWEVLERIADELLSEKNKPLE